ncbi:MAG: hypothetical protein R3E01_14460 [Pirellulaceae bacterium]
MIIRVHWLMLALLTCAFSAMVLHNWDTALVWLTRDLMQPHAEEALTISHTYLVGTDRWLTFPLPSDSNAVRLMTNANLLDRKIVTPRTANGRQGFMYCIEYRIVDSGDHELYAGDYHFRTEMPEAQTAANGESIAPQFYAVPGLVPAGTKAMRHSWREFAAAPNRMMVRLKTKDPNIQDVCVRAYCLVERPDYKLTYRWDRTSDSRKQRLCRASVYGPEMISDFERYNLLKRFWDPIPPAGVEGRHYVRRILYTRQEFDADRDDDSVLPTGLVIRPDCRGTMILPQLASRIMLHVMPLDEHPGKDQAPAITVNLKWFGKLPHERREWTLPTQQMPRDENVYCLDVDGGLIELQADAQIAVRALWSEPLVGDPNSFPRLRPYHGQKGGNEMSTNATEIDITPAPLRSAAYLVTCNGHVTYRVTHVAECPTPLRLALRVLLEQDQSLQGLEAPQPGLSPLEKVIARWEYLDQDNGIVDSGNLELDATRSEYDYVERHDGQLAVSEATVVHFAVPPGVRRVRIAAGKICTLVTAATRTEDVATRFALPPPDRPLPDAIKNVVSPEASRQADAAEVETEDEDARRLWFRILPENHTELAQELRKLTVASQVRPPETDPLLEDGHYEWTMLEPESEWISRSVLTPLAPGTPIREQAVDNTYCELESGKSYALQFYWQLGQTMAHPSLIFSRSRGGAGTVQVTVNDQPAMTIPVYGTHGEISLPDIPRPDRGTPTKLLIVCDDAQQLLINGVLQPPGRAFLARTVVRCDTPSMQFKFDKRHDEDFLSVRYYSDSEQEHTRLTIAIGSPHAKMNSPTTGWTILNRELSVASDPTASVTLLESDGKQLPVSAHHVMALSDDLPRGTYTVTVTQVGDARGYLQLSKIEVGQFSRQSVFLQEREGANAGSAPPLDRHFNFDAADPETQEL